MADYNSLEDLDQWISRQKEMYEAGYISAKELADAQKDYAAGIKGYTANLKQSMAQLGTSFKEMGKAIYDGKQGASTYNSTLSAGADAVSAYAQKFGPAGQALSLFTKAVVGFVNAALKQSDALYDSYAKISRTGTVGSQAMGEVFEQMRSFGYTVEQLGDMGDLLARNSKNFGTFAKSALDGSRAFGAVANSIQNSPIRQEFFRLGMSVNDINDGIAGYMNQQGKLGQLQGKSTKELTDGSQEYIKQLDLLSKLTGMTRQEQEDAREQALQVEAFYAGLADLDPKAQEQAMQAYTQALAKGGPKFAAEMAANFNGVITGASDAFLSTGGESMKYFGKEFFIRGGTADQSMAGIAGSITPAMAEVTKGLNQLGGGFGLNLRTINQLKGGIDPLAKITEKLAKEQADQLAGINPATKAQAGIRDKQIIASQNLAEFTNLGVNPATRALEIFTDVVEGITSMLPGATEAKKRRADLENAKKAPTSKKVFVGGQLYEEGSQEHKDALAGKPRAATPAGGGGGGGGGYESPVTGEVDLSGGGGAAPSGGRGMAGLRIKSGEATAGGESKAQLYEVAQLIQDKLGGGLKYFSAFNDAYHMDRNSNHNKGTAMDFTLTDPQQAASVAAMVQSIPGIGKVINEYANPSSGATGGHIHAEISAANGAILSGPSSGYRPNLTMHGTEAIVPLNTAAQQAAAGGGMDSSMLTAQLDKLDEMISIMKNQLGVQTKQMQLSS
jgi:hypothetical protein